MEQRKKCEWPPKCERLAEAIPTRLIPKKNAPPLLALLPAPVVFALYDAENIGVLSKRGMLSVLLPGDDQACVEAAFRTVSRSRFLLPLPSFCCECSAPAI